MIKSILTAAACILVAGSLQAQETLYLVKGDRVVAKYPVADIDYATFELPEGVKDIDDPVTPPEVTSYEFVGASGKYFGTQDDVANFQIELSTKAIGDETLPCTYLYLQFMSNAADFRDLKFEDGTYTIGDGETLDPFKFHPGISEMIDGQMGVGGTFRVVLPDAENADVTLVKDGSFTITTIDFGYKVAGSLVMQDDSVLEFSYEGYIRILNESDEQEPADEVPNPDSSITSDIDMGKLVEAYYTKYSGFFADEPRFEYVYLQMYPADAVNTYETCIDLGLIVDRNKYPDGLLPRGTYPVIKRTHSEFASNDLAALPAWGIQHDMGVAHYGCWYTTDYSVASPLVAGEVTVQDSDNSTIVLEFSLKDPDGHTVTGSFSGKPFILK